MATVITNLKQRIFQTGNVKLSVRQTWKQYEMDGKPLSLLNAHLWQTKSALCQPQACYMYFVLQVFFRC